MKKISNSSLKWVFNKARPIIWRIVFLTVCSSLVSYVSVRFALVSKELLDSALDDSKRIFFWSNLINLAILVSIQLALDIAYTLVALKTEGKFKNKIQLSLFNSIMYKSMPHLSKYHSGELLNRLNSDTNIISSNIVSIVPTVSALIARVVFGFFALYTLDSDFALIFLVVGPFVMIVARVYSRKVKPLNKKCLESQGKVHSFMLESLRNLLVIKSFRAVEPISEQTDKLQKNYLSLIMKKGFISIIANILFYISLTIGYYFAVGWCAWKIAKGIMTVGTFTAIIQLVGQVQSPFKELASAIPQVYAISASAERIMEIEAIPDEIHRYASADTEKIYKSMTGIDASNITFSYNEEKIFDNADVFIDKGSLVAISGISGIGKSTLIKLIMGILIPEKGEIKIVTDKTKYISDASLRGLFAYVPQGNMILSGSIRENIAFMRNDISDDEIIKASMQACIWDVISSLPSGLDTKLGEGGTGLSEGQMQRLAVARAICSGAPILLLDEATSALDEKTEREMLDNIMKNTDKTCIIISHKECALKKCNVSLSVSDGKIIKKINDSKA